jgi:RNA polymerase primary sigma factor
MNDLAIDHQLEDFKYVDGWEAGDEIADENGFITFDDSPADFYGIDQYMKEVKAIPILSHDQTLELFRKLADMRTEADSMSEDEALAVEEMLRKRDLQREISNIRDRLVSTNLRLVVFFANRYKGLGVSLPDLVQEGNYGLMRAIDKFDYHFGNRFSTYAMWWIIQGMIKAIHQQGRIIRVPHHMLGKYFRYLREQPSVPADGSSMDDAENAPEEMVAVKNILREPLSLDASVGNDGFELQEITTDVDQATPEERFIDKELRERLELSLKHLPGREETILRLRSGLDMPTARTLEQVGRIFHVSKERVRQIEKRAIKRLGEML